MRSRIAVAVLAGLSVALGFAQIAEAQEPQHSLDVTDVSIIEIGEDRSAVTYKALVTVENTGNADFAGARRVDYQVDGGEKTLVYMVTDLTAGEQAKFTFKLELEPGERTVAVLIGDTAYETSVRVSAVDLAVEVKDQRVVKGGVVELDVEVVNSGERVARAVELNGRWARLEEGEVKDFGEVAFGMVSDSIDTGESVEATVAFQLEPGSHRLWISASTASVESDLADNVAEVDYDVEFVELDVVVESAEVVRWRTEGSGLVYVTLGIRNVGVDDSDQLLIGVECEDGLCSHSRLARPIASGETATLTLEVWVPVGMVNATLYAGANDDGFRWGYENVVTTVFEVAEAPPLAWTLSAVSEAQDLQYWSDGSANVVFETTMLNLGDETVSGEVHIAIACLRSGEVVESCGGEYPVSLEGEDDQNVTRHTVKVPQGETKLHFSIGDEDVLIADVDVPKRILGVSREVWDCFSDTSNLRREAGRDSGVGCAGWRNDFVTKWAVGKPITVWSTGDDEYETIFDEVLDYLGPLLNVEFERVNSKSMADLHAYLGLPRSERISGLGCNRAAGCTSFEIAPDGAIVRAQLVVWPPVSINTDAGRNHMVYSITLHELMHGLTGMLHRHDDRTSLMSYDALDYTTLGVTDAALIRIVSDPMVEPGMRFNEVRELVVFEDELVDEVVPMEVTVKDVLRRAHAKLMDSESASYKISGGWTGCDFLFKDSRYSIGSARPRVSRWVHFQNETVDLYIIRSRTPLQLIEFWMLVDGEWQPMENLVGQNALSFRDSFTSPLTMLSSINLYGDGAELEVVSETDDVLTLEVSLEGADVRTDWSQNTRLDVELSVDKTDYTIPSYEMTWEFKPHSQGVCDSYSVTASQAEYAIEFEFPDPILDTSAVLRLENEG